MVDMNAIEMNDKPFEILPPVNSGITPLLGKFVKWVAQRPDSKSAPQILYSNVSLRIADPSFRAA
jgi:hypothetical protein